MNQLEEQRIETPSSNGKPAAHDHGHADHPIPQDLPRIGWGAVLLVLLVVAGLFAGLFFLGWAPHQKREAELMQDAAEARESKPVVEVSLPKHSEATTDLVLPGSVESFQSTSIYTRANGYLKNILVDIGDHVKAGQLLAEIDSPEVDAQLQEAKAQLQQANVTVGRATNEYNFNKDTFERYQGLAKTGGITKQQLDEKRAAFNIATSSLAAAKATVNAAQASVEKYTQMQGFEKVLAPFDGTITARNYDKGALLSPAATGPGKELFQIDQTNVLRVFVKVPQTYVTSMKAGQDAELLVRNYPARPFKGTVVRSAGALDPTTRTLRFEVDFPNDDHALFPGMYGQVRFHVHQDHPTLIVPTSALLFQADGLKVAVVDDGKIRYHHVTVGRDFGAEAEVAAGLSGDEQVVTNPGGRLVEGAEVTVLSHPEKVAEQPAAKAQVSSR